MADKKRQNDAGTNPVYTAADLPEEYAPVAASGSETAIPTAPGIVATRIGPHFRQIQEAYAKGLRPAIAGSGLILNEDEFIIEPQTGRIMDGEMFIFVEKESHREGRIAEEHRKAMERRDMIASMNSELSKDLQGVVKGARVESRNSVRVDSPSIPPSPQVTNTQELAFGDPRAESLLQAAYQQSNPGPYGQQGPLTVGPSES